MDIYRAEPYVYSQMTAGKDAQNPGEGKNSWLTGTAAWSFIAVSQYILGIHPDYNGFIIDPCIPSSWKEFAVNRKFRGSMFKIKIYNPNNVNKGVKKILLDSKKITSGYIPYSNGQAEHSVEVELG